MTIDNEYARYINRGILPRAVHRLIKSKHACGQWYARMSKYVTREKSSSVLLSPFPKVALKITCAAKATKRKIVKPMARWSERIALDIRGVDSLLGSAERDVFLLDGWVPQAAGAFRGGMTRDGGKSERENEKKRPEVARWEHSSERKRSENGGRQLRRDTNSCRCSTKWRPLLLNPFAPRPTSLRPISYHPPNSPFDTGSGVPIDLDRLKTRRNHRRQLLRTPLSGMSCGRIGVGEILARELFCRWMSNDALSSVQLLKVDREERCGDYCNGERARSWNQRGLSAINKILGTMYNI